jgi:heat shock protein HslJ
MHGPRSIRLISPAALVLALGVIGCASTTGGESRVRTAEAIVGKLWQWEAMVPPAEKIEVPSPDRYTFELLPDGKVAARLDCNRGAGTYQIADGKITFSPMASTRAACPPGSPDTRFARDLGRAVSFFVEGGKLYLELPADSGTMRFRPAG